MLLLAGSFFQKRLTYFPESLGPSERIALSPRDREVWIEIPETGRIHGIYREGESGRLTVLFLHGNAGNVVRWKGVHDGFAAMDFGILTIDYPGFGRSEGSPSEEALYASAHAAVKFLRDFGVDSKDVVIFGKSLGTAVAVELGASGGFAGVILESPFTSLAAAGKEHYWFVPVSLLLRERYESISRIGNVRCPLLMVIGSRDKLIPPAQSMELFSEAGEPKEVFRVEGAGHNDIQAVGGGEYWNRLREWLGGLR